MSEVAVDGKLDWQTLIDEALTQPGRISEAYSRFYNYSYLNCLLLRMQGVLEPVATYKRWQQLGRQVLKGSRAKVIVRPIVVKREDERGEEQTFTRFKPVKCLFGLSETQGEELPEAPVPSWDVDRALTTLDIERVPFESINGNVQGYSFERKFAINPLAEHPHKTLFHELGHIVLGHTARDQHAEYVAHRGVKEFQAEATAYLSMNEVGQLDEDTAAESRGYIHNWLLSERPPDAAIRQVFGATDQILRAGRPEASA